MNQVSSYELATGLASAKPGGEHNDRAIDLIQSIAGGSETAEASRIAEGVASAMTMVKASGDENGAFDLARAAAFLVAFADVTEPDRSLDSEVSAYQLLALSRAISHENAAEYGAAISSDGITTIASSASAALAGDLYDGLRVSDNELAQMIPAMANAGLLAATDEEQSRASELVSAVKMGEAVTGTDASIAGAIKIVEGELPSEGMEAAVGRMLAARRHSGGEPSVHDAALQISADILLQRQAGMILAGSSDGNEEQFEGLHKVVAIGGPIRASLVAQSQGDFEGMSRGGKIDIARDISGGAVLPEKVRMSIQVLVQGQGIGLEPAQMAEANARLGASVA